jgi:hypothetical protein
MAGFKVESQFPQPWIKITKPDNAIVELKPNYAGTSAGGNSIISQNLLSYTFSEAVDDLMGSFSFSVENEMISGLNKSLFDLIPLRGVIDIYEGGQETPVFRGIIRRRHNGITMTASGPRKSTVFSGKSIISCITEFMVPLDPRLPHVSSAIEKTKTLQSQLGKNDMTIKSFMETTWDYFKQVSEEVSKDSELVNKGLLKMIDNHIGGDFIQTSGSETHLKYPVATMFYSQNNNYITDVWHNILPKPVYELFARFDGTEPVIVARQVPFGDPDNGNDDWQELEPLYPIEPVMLVGYDLAQSDEEVYTAFNAYVIGSPNSREFYQVVSDRVDSNLEIDKDKSAIYGFKQLTVSFTGFDRMTNDDKADERQNELSDALKKLNARTKYWFSRMDEMYSGTITLTTNFKDIAKNPKAGYRVNFLGGQFYVEKSEHSWNYGKTPLNRLTVSRGMIYSDKGKIEKKIPEIGKLYGELSG